MIYKTFIFTTENSVNERVLTSGNWYTGTNERMFLLKLNTISRFLLSFNSEHETKFSHRIFLFLPELRF